jgi:hypothetical protein
MRRHQEHRPEGLNLILTRYEATLIGWLSGRFDSFIVGRAIAGAAGCGMYMGLLTLLSVTTDNVERPKLN